MSERDDAVPRPIAREETQGTRIAIAERDLQRLERELKELRQSCDARFGHGSDTFAGVRAELQRVRDQVEGKVSARHQTLKDEAHEIEERLGAQIRALAESVAEIAPRATPTRLVGWVAAAFFAVGAPVASYLLSSARAPERSEVREIENRLRAIELRVTTIDARLGARGATP